MKAVRVYAYQYGKAVNAHNARYAPWLATMTSSLQKTSKDSFQGDLKTTYPGPLPLTPVSVGKVKGHDVVSACVWATGWGLDPKTHAPAQAKTILPIRWQLTKVDGKWKVAGTTKDKTIDCHGTQVMGRPW